MAPYAVPDDVREAVAPDGNYVGTCAELSDEQIARAIIRAQDLVDATTGVQFTSNNAPSLVVGLVIALASYYATLAYRKGHELSEFHPIQLAYTDARSTLKDIRTNVIQVEQPTEASVPPQRSAPLVINPAGMRGGTMFTLSDFGLDVKTTDSGDDDDMVGPTIEPGLTRQGMIP